MANPVKGEAELKLEDGREFTLLLDMEGLVQAEAQYGKPMKDLLADTAKGFVGASRALLWGGLRQHHPEVTPKQALAMLEDEGEAVALAIAAAVTSAFPDAADDDEEEKDEKSKSPPSKRSGGSGAKRG